MHTSFRYLSSTVGEYGWIIDHFDVGTAFFNPDVDDNDMNWTLPETWPEGLNAPTILV